MNLNFLVRLNAGRGVGFASVLQSGSLCMIGITEVKGLPYYEFSLSTAPLQTLNVCIEDPATPTTR